MASGIRFDNVSFRYPNKPDVLAHLDITIKPRSFLGIVGINGSGKSTLTYLTNGLIPHSIPGTLSGHVFVDGVDTRTKSVAYFSKCIGMVFQNPDFSLFNLTVAEEIAFGLKNLNGHLNQKVIKEALGLVGLRGYETRDPQTLSFGEKQKVCLASVLALDVSYIVLDEPTAMLDWKSSSELYRLLKKLNMQGKTIIVVEHDTDFLWDVASEVLILDKGKVKAMGMSHEVLAKNDVLASLGIKQPHPGRL